MVRVRLSPRAVHTRWPRPGQDAIASRKKEWAVELPRALRL